MDGMRLTTPTNEVMNKINELSTEIIGIGQHIIGYKYPTVIIKLGDKESKLEADLDSNKKSVNHSESDINKVVS